MTEFIVLSKVDMLTLCNDKPVTVHIDKKPYVLCTDECFEKQMTESEDKGGRRMKEIVIKLSDVTYERLIESKGLSTYAFMSFVEAVKNGTELPKGHGRLIDADAFIEFLKHKEYGMIDYSDCVIDDITEDAPTIIEADKEEE